MPSLLIRNLSERTKRALRIQAAENGRSMSEEARSLIEVATEKAENQAPVATTNWVDDLLKTMKSFGEAELVLPPRLPSPAPPDFSGPEFD